MIGTMLPISVPVLRVHTYIILHELNGHIRYFTYREVGT